MDNLILITREKDLIFSGTEDSFSEFSTKLQISSDIEFEFIPSKFNSPFYKLARKLSRTSLLYIISNSSLKEYNTEEDEFFGKHGLSIEYIYKAPYLLLLSIGEAHRGVYKVIKEALWYAPDLVYIKEDKKEEDTKTKNRINFDWFEDD